MCSPSRWVACSCGAVLHWWVCVVGAGMSIVTVVNSHMVCFDVLRVFEFCQDSSRLVLFVQLPFISFHQCAYLPRCHLFHPHHHPRMATLIQMDQSLTAKYPQNHRLTETAVRLRPLLTLSMVILSEFQPPRKPCSLYLDLQAVLRELWTFFRNLEATHSSCHSQALSELS